MSAAEALSRRIRRTSFMTESIPRASNRIPLRDLSQRYTLNYWRRLYAVRVCETQFGEKL